MNGSTRIGVRPVSPAPQSPWGIVATHDFDGDGDTDLALQNETTGVVELWWMQGTERVGDPEPIHDAIVPQHGEVPDYPSPLHRIRGAGLFQGPLPDLLCQGPTGDIIIWNLHRAQRLNRVFLKPDATGTSWRVRAAGPFDGDGRADLLLEDESTGHLQIWSYEEHSGSDPVILERKSILAPFPEAPGAINWRVFALADLGPGPDDPGDVPPPVCGATDFLWQNLDSGRTAVWHLDPAVHRSGGLFTAPDGPGPGWWLVGPR